MYNISHVVQVITCVIPFLLPFKTVVKEWCLMKTGKKKHPSSIKPRAAILRRVWQVQVWCFRRWTGSRHGSLWGPHLEDSLMFAQCLAMRAWGYHGIVGSRTNNVEYGSVWKWGIPPTRFIAQFFMERSSHGFRGTVFWDKPKVPWQSTCRVEDLRSFRWEVKSCSSPAAWWRQLLTTHGKRFLKG